MKFSEVKRWKIPEGNVTHVRKKNSDTLWGDIRYRYVSLGDSIAVGHRIDENWETDYGWDAQYGKEGRKETVIVPNSYTDLIRKYLYNVYGTGYVRAKSFAVSGSKIRREPIDSRSLIDILDDVPVENSLSKANLVTVSIGANTILEPALNIVIDYLINGTDLAPVEAEIEDALRDLANPDYEYSYKALFDKLLGINPNAQYVFTTVYNPMKYLYIERGTWENDFRDGFFGTWINTIPEMTILGWEVDKEIKKLILDTPAFANLRERINGSDNLISISKWVERYLETGGVSANGKSYLGLNQIIRNAVKGYSNISVTETHELFDAVPDRQGAGELHYNDLVNMQITRGYDANDMNWDALWGNAEGENTADKIRNYWIGAIMRHISLSEFDVSGLATELMPTIVNDVLSPAFDPHPRSDGQYAMMRSFLDTLGWESLPTVTYNANGGSGVMSAQKVLNTSIVNGVSKSAYSILKPNSFIGQTGYYFTNWNTNANGGGTSYSNGQSIYVNANKNLYAQWSNIYTVTYRHSKASNYHGSGDTGPMECYALWIDGVEQADLGAFSNPARQIRLAYGTPVGVIVETKSGAGRSYITWNGNKVKGASSRETYDFQVKSNMDINFEWNYWLDATIPPEQSYWNCYITTK